MKPNHRHGVAASKTPQEKATASGYRIAFFIVKLQGDEIRGRFFQCSNKSPQNTQLFSSH